MPCQQTYTETKPTCTYKACGNACHFSVFLFSSATRSGEGDGGNAITLGRKPQPFMNLMRIFSTSFLSYVLRSIKFNSISKSVKSLLASLSLIISCNRPSAFSLILQHSLLLQSTLFFNVIYLKRNNPSLRLYIFRRNLSSKKRKFVLLHNKRENYQ